MSVTLLTSRNRTPAADTAVSRLEQVQRHARLIAHRIQSDHHPEDLAQRATLCYWHTFGDGRGPASLPAWLKRALDRLAVNDDTPPHQRRETRPLPAAVTATDADVDQMLRHLTNRSQTVVRDDQRRRVLDRIDRQDLHVLRMRLSGQSSLQVAQSLQTTPQAADQAYARARRQLKMAISTEPGLQRQLRSGVPTPWRRAS